jgi:hypothetical protein
MKFSLSGPSLFLHHHLSTRSGFVRIEEPDMLLADHPYRHLSTSRICQPPPPINEDVIDRCHATDDGFHSMDVRYTSDSSNGANNTYGLEIGDKAFYVMDSSDKTEQNDGHHKSGMKRKTIARTEEASSKIILINRCGGHTSNPRPPRQHFSSGSRHRFRTRDKTGRSSCMNSIARRPSLRAISWSY